MWPGKRSGTCHKGTSEHSSHTGQAGGRPRTATGLHSLGKGPALLGHLQLWLLRNSGCSAQVHNDLRESTEGGQVEQTLNKNVCVVLKKTTLTPQVSYILSWLSKIVLPCVLFTIWFPLPNANIQLNHGPRPPWCTLLLTPVFLEHTNTILQFLVLFPPNHVTLCHWGHSLTVGVVHTNKGHFLDPKCKRRCL